MLRVSHFWASYLEREAIEMSAISIEEHRDWLVRQKVGAEAEYMGYMAAAYATFPLPPPYSTDRYIQERYEAGFRDGQGKLLQATLEKENLR
jgi:hypothetical protein